MFRSVLSGVIVTAFVCAGSALAAAQDSGNNSQAPASAPQSAPARGPFDPAKRAEMIGKRLNLSSDQQTKVEGILKSEQSQVESLRADSSVSLDERRSKMMELHKSSSDQIRALLDPDQQKKWDEMQSRRGEWMRGHGPGPAPRGPASEASPNSN